MGFGTPGAVVVVCSQCGSALARRDVSLETLGKIGDILATDTPLALGVQGVYRGMPFDIVGHAQMLSKAGGLWDEWYVFIQQSQRWAWLAEAQGELWWTWPTDVSTDKLPSTYELGGTVVFQNKTLEVTEMDSARCVAVAGELPFKPEWEYNKRYIDLRRGADAASVNLDDDEPTALYHGHVVTFAELGLDKLVKQQVMKQVPARRLGCPQCGGSLTLHLPEQSQRLGCPFCGSLLDTRNEAVEIIVASERLEGVCLLPLGCKGTMQGVEYQVMGMLTRSTMPAMTRYFWDEYLLYAPGHGFRWLVCSDTHWTFVEDVTSTQADALRKAKRFRFFQGGEARVERVIGEFYWQVKQADVTQTQDFACIPWLLSKEISETEVRWSKGIYTPVDTINRAFGLKLRKPQGVVAHQPWPHVDLVKVASSFLALTIALAVLSAPLGHTVTDSTYDLPAQANGQDSFTVFSEPFQLTRGRNVAVTFRDQDLDQTWMAVDADLVGTDSGEVSPFSTELSYYSGFDSDGSWTEGSRDQTTYLSAVSVGTYSLRMEAQWEHYDKPQRLQVTIEQGRTNYTVTGLIVLFHFCAFLAMLIWWGSFESDRMKSMETD